MYLLWLIPGNLWYWKCQDCYQTAPLLSTLTAVFLVAGYGYVLIPAFILVSVCLCLPVLIGVIMCVTSQGQTQTKKDVIKSLKEEKYDPKLHQESTCAICASDFESGQALIPLPCDSRHLFHSFCIQRWLNINSNCPICRAAVQR